MTNKQSSHKSHNEPVEMRKLFVDNLSADITEHDIYAVFSQHGEIEEVAKYQNRRIPTRYFAFVIYKYAKDCVKATHNPCPIIRGRKCDCILAAIGKQFSGYKFFVEKGLLTEEQKKQHAVHQSNSKHQKKKRSQKRRHRNKKSKKDPPRLNVPSFKDPPLSQRSGMRSNSSYQSATPSMYYEDRPSYSQFDSHSTIMSNCNQYTAQRPRFHRESKSLHYYEPHHRLRIQHQQYSNPFPSYPCSNQSIAHYYPPPAILPPQAHSMTYPPPQAQPTASYTPLYQAQPPRVPVLKRSGQQHQSAPKLPSFGTDTQYVTPPYRVRRTMSHPVLFRENNETNEPLYQGDCEIEVPDMDLWDIDLNNDFAELEIELTPPPPLEMNASKPTVTFKSIEDAKKASDKELEAGFTMLHSPEMM
eukprot:253582_1